MFTFLRLTGHRLLLELVSPISSCACPTISYQTITFRTNYRSHRYESRTGSPTGRYRNFVLYQVGGGLSLPLNIAQTHFVQFSLVYRHAVDFKPATKLHKRDLYPIRLGLQ